MEYKSRLQRWAQHRPSILFIFLLPLLYSLIVAISAVIYTAVEPIFGPLWEAIVIIILFGMPLTLLAGYAYITGNRRIATITGFTFSFLSTFYHSLFEIIEKGESALIFQYPLTAYIDIFIWIILIWAIILGTYSFLAAYLIAKKEYGFLILLSIYTFVILAISGLGG